MSQEPVLGNAKLWWQYAITSTREEIHERNLSSTWDRVLSKAKENVRYVTAFQSYLKNPVVVEPEDKELKERTFKNLIMKIVNLILALQI